MSLNHTLRLLFALSAAIALPLSLSACAPDDETVANSPPPPSIDQAPPEVGEIEMIPFIDNPQSEIWRPGYWALLDGQFVWIPGKILPRPSPTAVWASAHWVHHTYGWSFEQGHWQ